ncbi:MAG: 4-alpha-glucanotransferase [Balneolaceae bacterium]
MRFPRSCGVLLHPTSLPSPYGLGDFGPGAYRFLNLLEETGHTIWQVLPLTPVGYGNSPYTAYSAFAGSPWLISPEVLVEKGLLEKYEAEGAVLPESVRADYESAYAVRGKLLKLAADRFFMDADSGMLSRFEQFQKENRAWLKDYALFMVAHEASGGEPWYRWERGLAKRKSRELKQLGQEYRERLQFHLWAQFEFYNQWNALRSAANRVGIRIVGDIPIFVDHNSADVWAYPEYFTVDSSGARERVAGVPPDYFSETGQLWGNPLYRWDRLQKDGYGWWIDRFRQMFRLFDAIRVDHFRGFEACWEVQAKASTAEHGEWVKGPGAKLFAAVIKELGELPVIAEDLGLITPEVEQLRDKFRFPGMKVLQFAFNSGPSNGFLPHNYGPNCVVYTGTHDNDTTLGWYRSAPVEEQHRMRVYTRSDGSLPHRELIRYAYHSVADQAIVPLQDFLGLGPDSRMNTPGTVGGNWEWRVTDSMLESLDREWMRELAIWSRRLPD